jgi:hypothetical protein
VPSPAELTLWLLTALVEAFAVYIFLVQGLFRRFLLLTLYLLLCAMVTASRLAVFYHFGSYSSEYVYFYYFSDALLTVSLFLSISELSLRLLGTRVYRKNIIRGCSAVLLVAAVISFSNVSSSSSKLFTHFVVELSWNLFLASSLAIAALWVWKCFNEPEDRIAARCVSVLIVFSSTVLLIYELLQRAPQISHNSVVVTMMAVWVPLGCGFAAVSQGQPRITKL